MNEADARFQQCVNFVLARETEYDTAGRVRIERDPNDPGGVTKYGIDQRDHPFVDVAKLTRPEAEEIYRFNEWSKARCAELKEPWDLAVFDSAVNPGLGWTSRHLQKAVGATADGVIGPKTIAAVNAAGDQQLIEFLRARCQYYRNLPAKRAGKPYGERYLSGWLNRVALLTEATLGNTDRVMMA